MQATTKLRPQKSVGDLRGRKKLQHHLLLWAEILMTIAVIVTKIWREIQILPQWLLEVIRGRRQQQRPQLKTTVIQVMVNNKLVQKIIRILQIRVLPRTIWVAESWPQDATVIWIALQRPQGIILRNLPKKNEWVHSKYWLGIASESIDRVLPRF